MLKIGNKKGLSDVVTTLIIILLSLVAVGIVWVVVNNLISGGTEDINLGQFTIDVDFVSASVNGNNITMTVKRTSGQGNMSSLKFIISDGSNSEEFTEEQSLIALQTKTFTVTLASLSPANVKTASVAPVYRSSSGEDVTGEVTDTYDFGTGSGSGNNGNENGGTGDPDTGICGDLIIQNPNGDSPAINEQCDGTNWGTVTGCADIPGFIGGTLSCDSGCQFDTSLCNQGTPETPVSCDGAWSPPEDAGVECDGTPLPNGCSASCMCEQGFTEDGFGGCSLNPAINEGTINTVWNSIYFDSNNLPKSEVTMSGYTNNAYYVNFSNSPETACFQITFADYVVDTDISYLRLSDALGFPNIATGENYHVWEAQSCGL